MPTRRNRECSVFKSFDISPSDLDPDKRNALLRESIHIVCTRGRDPNRPARISDIAWHVSWDLDESWHSDVLMIEAIWNTRNIRNISVRESRSLVSRAMIEIVEDFKTRSLSSLEEEFFARNV